MEDEISAALREIAARLKPTLDDTREDVTYRIDMTKTTIAFEIRVSDVPLQRMEVKL